ncbi:MAG: RdgB/HAM1 family non-canonical purine NTP pyrophosphatase [Clostridia bacterium]|nr:RdgB/HAM1 family non-canonical purine NTP pyrophosphatase [Clostridia bacterium]
MLWYNQEKVNKEQKKVEKKTIVVATGNVHKLREFAEIFPEYHFVTQKQAGFFEEVEETGKTFRENALIKAMAASKALNLPTVADDSGICVDALGGAPGVYSARYSGEHGDDKKNRDLLLENLKSKTDKADRTAYFCSAIVLCYPDGTYYEAEGKTYGKILFEEQGSGGFGYDCIFESDDLKKSFGLATPEEKNAVSHRFRALQKLKEQIKEI